MSRPPINDTAVMMAAVHILTSAYGHDENVFFPSVKNRARDAAMDDCARLAWALKEAVERAAPGSAELVPFVRSPKLRPVPWDSAPAGESEPKTPAASDK